MAKARQKGKAKPKAKPKPKKRDHKAEYRRRKARAKKLGLSVRVARGHAAPGEVSFAELRSLKKGAGVYVKRGSTLRTAAAERIAEVADVTAPTAITPAQRRRRRDFDGRAFVDAMIHLGLAASRHEAYTLWFSP
jgi:hypothetical protein